jgi:hypothetical protein
VSRHGPPSKDGAVDDSLVELRGWLPPARRLCIVHTPWLLLCLKPSRARGGGWERARGLLGSQRGRRFGRIRVESAARACRVDHSALSLYLVPQRPQARGYTLPTPNQPINRRGVVGESSAPPHTSSELRRRSGGGGDAGIRRTGGLTATCYCHTPPGASLVSRHVDWVSSMWREWPHGMSFKYRVVLDPREHRLRPPNLPRACASPNSLLECVRSVQD